MFRIVLTYNILRGNINGKSEATKWLNFLIFVMNDSKQVVPEQLKYNLRNGVHIQIHSFINTSTLFYLVLFRISCDSKINVNWTLLCTGV